jgi:Spy/CpxP family protein refolding chaperone
MIIRAAGLSFLPQEVVMFGHGQFGGFPGKGFGRFEGAPWGQRGGFGGHGHGHGMKHFLRGIDLTDEQVQKLGELGGDAFLQFGHTKLDMIALYRQLFKEMAAPQVDEAKVRAIGEKIKTLKGESTDRMVEKFLAFSNILTPEQRSRVRTNRIRHFFGFGEGEHEDEE